MTEEGKHQGLGRGLSALLGEGEDDYASLDRLRTSKDVPVEHLRPNRNQPRRRFGDETAAALVESVRAHGILQPILVRRLGEDGDGYEIIAGERRWRAAQRAQLHQVPVIVKEVDDTVALELTLVENIQREDLTAIEEAGAYRHLIDEFRYTQEQLGEAVGKSRSHIANTLRLLGLPETVKAMIEDGRLTAGHARALLAADDPAALARTIVDQGLSVREVERLVQRGPVAKRRRQPVPETNPDTLALERDISHALGLEVGIRHRSDGRGYVKIKYKTLEQLEEVCQRLCHHAEDADASDSGAPES